MQSIQTSKWDCLKFKSTASTQRMLQKLMTVLLFFSFKISESVVAVGREGVAGGRGWVRLGEWRVERFDLWYAIGRQTLTLKSESARENDNLTGCWMLCGGSLMSSSWWSRAQCNIQAYESVKKTKNARVESWTQRFFPLRFPPRRFSFVCYRFSLFTNR